MSAQPSVLQVVILRDGLLVGTEVFVPGTYAIGSDASCDLRLDDTSIDPRHAMLYFQNGRSAIQDAGSVQGVYVNGHRVSACEIRPVDEVLCGPFVLKTRVLSQRPAEKPQPPPEVAALLGGAPPPAAPPQGARSLWPAAQADFEEPAPQELMAGTVPTAYAPQGRAQHPPPASTSRGGPMAQHPPPASTSRGGPMAQHPPPAATSRGGPMAQHPPPAATSRGGPVAQHPPPAATSRGGPVAQHPPPASTSRGGPVAYAQHPPPASTSRGGPVPVQAQQAMPATAVIPAQPVPANTVPSVRRRAAQDLPPSPESAPSALVAEDLFGDMLPPEEAPGSQWAPMPEEASAGAQLPVMPGLFAEEPVRTARPNEPARPAHAPKLGPGKGKPQLYLELYWGGIRREARRFAPGKKPLVASTDELSPMPLWGFSLPEEGFTLAESLDGAYRLYVPPGSTVEKANSGAKYTPVQLTALEADGTRRFITLRDGTAARITQGQMSLVAYAAPKPDKVWVNPLAGLPWLALFFYAVFGAGFGAFVVMRPQSPESPDFTQKNLPPVALRLLAPEPKKKEEAKKKLEAIKEKAKPVKKAEKAPEKVAEKPKPVEKAPPPKEKEVAQPPPPPESKALKALAKLSAAGPATNDVLAAVDKLGSGPGNKNVKTSNYKLSGLIGKAPIANAGLGTFGLGGGGKGGGATLGAELLRGKGGGGIGALGVGSVGKGKVGGTVTRATSRSISAAQGSIDREAVAKVINSHLQEVHACYERALLKDPGLAGKVVLEWTIGLSGSVTAAKTKSSTLRNSAVEACILSNLKKWSFPAPKGGLVIITYPFIFNSVGY